MASLLAEPTLTFSASAIKAPYNTSVAPSMADTLPALNFGFDDLRARMSGFTQQFDAFIEKGRKRVLEERNQFRMSVASVQEQCIHKQRDITVLNSKGEQHAANIAAQAAETEEMNNAITSLTAQRDAHAAKLASLRSRLSSARSEIRTKKAKQHEQSQYMEQQTSLDKPELEFWESCLGLRIEGTGTEDRIRFTFFGCDREKPEKEAWFELDMSDRDSFGYDVPASRPKLQKENVAACVERMFEMDDLRGFLKGMRELFMQEMRPKRMS